ncbi:MAG: hypothetical protein ABI388_08525, partial [Bacteroidia bacterium]
MKLTHYIYILFLLATQITWAQQNKNKVKSSSYNYDTLNKIIINGLNKFRNEHGLDSLQSQEILVNAAVLSSTQMADDEKINPQGLAKTTPKYLKKAGATKKGEELAVVTPLGKGSNQLEPIVVAKAILQKWTL